MGVPKIKKEEKKGIKCPHGRTMLKKALNISPPHPFDIIRAHFEESFSYFPNGMGGGTPLPLLIGI